MEYDPELPRSSGCHVRDRSGGIRGGLRARRAEELRRPGPPPSQTEESDMCGITGFWKQPAAPPHVMTEWGTAMNRALWHRGPDDGGVWSDHGAGIVLANRRLAILDLSPAG